MVWVPDPGRWGTLPAEGVLGAQDLPEAVARIGLLPGDPVYIRPDGRGTGATTDSRAIWPAVHRGERLVRRQIEVTVGGHIW